MPKIIPLKEQIIEFEKQCFSGADSKRILSMYNSIVSQTRDFVKGAGFEDVVIGLSGGIDSSLVASIAVDALGNDHVHGILLPGPYTSQDSINDAKTLAENLQIDTKTIFIDSVYESVVASLQQAKINGKKKEIADLTSQNIQARCRMIMIMAVSNEKNWMMLNTGNKSEVYTGYSTMYGDMAGAYAPIGAVYKCDVYKMCVAKNLQGRRVFEDNMDLIPLSIIEKPASAELTSNQTDEKSLGVDYATLDAILKEHVDNNQDANQIVFLGYNQTEVQNVLNLVKRSAFKRPFEPPCAKV